MFSRGSGRRRKRGRRATITGGSRSGSCGSPDAAGHSVAPAACRPDFPAHRRGLYQRRPSRAAVVGSRQRGPTDPQQREHHGHRDARPRTSTDTEPTIGRLVTDASRDISTLISKEIQLAKSELKVSVKDGGTGIGLFAAAGVPRRARRSSCSRSRSPTSSTGTATGLDLQWAFLIVFVVYLLIAAPARLPRRQEGQEGRARPEKAIAAGQADPAARSRASPARTSRPALTPSTRADARARPTVASRAVPVETSAVLASPTLRCGRPAPR